LAVREYLASLGIDGAVIQTRSYGEELPAVYGHDEQAWNKNRRVVFVVYWTALGFQEWEVITPLFLPSEG
jgi:outer membrane protein OmpA-like peptidoglycan-associated protein